jgi:oligoribonuclease NrnB/cAMP/cGMP phosphodiesterase (DHH superfamily)
MKTVCVYHSIDLDGWMSAAIVRYWFEREYRQDALILNAPEGKDKVGHRVSSINTLNHNQSLTFMGYNYGDPMPDLSEYDKVIICDVSLPKRDMYKINLEKELIWIDHHISAIKDIFEDAFDGESAISGLRDTNFAACELTWQYFFPNETMPEIVRLLGRYDCFGHKTKSFEMTEEGYNKAKKYLIEVNRFEDFENNKTSTDGYSLVYYANDVAKFLSEEQKVLEFQYGARQCITNYEEAYNWLKASIMTNHYSFKIRMKIVIQSVEDEIQEKGKIIYSYLCTEAKQTYKNGFEILLKEPVEIYSESGLGTQPIVFNPPKEGKIIRKFICINKERFNPINFGIDYHKEGYDGCACFYLRSDGKWSFSLYNDNGQVDCSNIAKQYGGGGHFSASGMIVNNETFLKIIK